MKTPSKKLLIGIGDIVVVVIGFILLTTVGKPLFSKTITAEKLDDFKSVCYNDKIGNAAAYTSHDKAVIAVFYEQPYSKDNPWNNYSGSSSDTFYAKYGEHTKANVVACFDYKSSGNKQVATCSGDIKLMSARYIPTFYEAKTGKKIAEGKEIVVDDSICPSVMVYDKLSKKTAKALDTDTMHEAIAEFVGK